MTSPSRLTTHDPRPTLFVRELGQVPYAEALALQRQLVEERIAGRIGDTLLLLEHPPVMTLGRGWKTSSLPIDPASLRRRGIDVHEIERGGDVTYHGPGQLVGYPIIDLQQHKPDLHWYLRQLEQSLVQALSSLGIEAGVRPGLTGVWVGTRKIASIGIHVRQWVTSHGFALNVTTDLSPFSLIVPCGIPDVQMTSVMLQADERMSGRADQGVPGMAAEVRKSVITAFTEIFGYGESMSQASAHPLIRSSA